MSFTVTIIGEGGVLNVFKSNHMTDLMDWIEKYVNKRISIYMEKAKFIKVESKGMIGVSKFSRDIKFAINAAHIAAYNRADALAAVEAA